MFKKKIHVNPISELGDQFTQSWCHPLILGGTLGSKRQTMGEEPSKIRGNIPFRNMQNIFTGLENAFAGPGWPWKPHKSKEQIFLHRSYTQKIFATLKKKIAIEKKSKKSKKSEKKNRKIRNKKIRDFSKSQISKFWNLRF